MEPKIPRMPFALRFDQRFDCIEDESDENPDSSDDELDIILHGTPKQKRKLSRSLSRGSLELSSSSEDEFEKEMEKELNETVKRHEEQYSSKSGNPPAQGSAAAGSSTQQLDPSLAKQFYDDVYFDSDDSDMEEEKQAKKEKQGTDKKKKPKRKVIPDDELLYDPDIDDENQKWVDKQRQRYRNQQNPQDPPKTSGDAPATESQAEAKPDTNESPGENPPPSTTKNATKLPKSDALLNCPACLTTLCLDCQRHDLYNNQYRAMFVLNCSIIKSERLKYPVPKKKGRRWSKNKGKRTREEVGEGSVPNLERNGDNPEELFFPVKCSVCNTEVAVYDDDEIFHFFNVLASTA